MHVWLLLLSRELLFLALLIALGSAPVSFLSARFDGAARAALAPAFGLCVGVCLTVTLIYAFPAADTGWVVIAFASASLALGLRRLRTIRWPGTRDVVQVTVIAVVILGSFSYALAERHTVGPAGGYQVGDTSGYVSEINGEAHTPIHQADRIHPPFADLSLGYWATYAQAYQQLDVSALEANVNRLLGLQSTDTQSPFLIAVILAGALGAFASVRAAARRPTWGAVLAGSLFAGSLFTELFMDGSQAALAGSALLAPIVVVELDALRYRKPATLVLLALLAAGLQTIYPLFVPCVATAGLVALVVVAASRWRRAALRRQDLTLGAAQVLGVVALGCAFTPVAFVRNLRYWHSLLTGSLSFAMLPRYKLPVDVLPGWILQTRDFYRLVTLQGGTSEVLMFAALVPALLIAVITFGMSRHRAAIVMLVVAAGASLLAYYTWAGRGCEYCVQRNLIPVGALAPAAIGLGVAALAALKSRSGLILAGGAVALTLVGIGQASIVEHQRLANGSYLLDRQDREALGALPANAGPLEIEGFAEGQQPPMELPLIYDLADERTDHHVSLPTVTDDSNSLGYLGGTQPLGPSFKPNYRYVLTRLGAIATQRQVVARFGPIALERRTHDLDVTLTGGVHVAPARVDATGVAWATHQLKFMVVGGHPAGQAWVSLVLATTVPVTVVTGAGASIVNRAGRRLEVCVRAAGRAPARNASVTLAFKSQAAPLPDQQYADPLPTRGVRLLSMGVSGASCRGSARRERSRHSRARDSLVSGSRLS
jgi:hypothetical protein